MSFRAAFRGKAEEQQHPQTHQVAGAGTETMEPKVPAALIPKYSRKQVCHFGLEMKTFCFWTKY
jgi:hypothetical protein